MNTPSCFLKIGYSYLIIFIQFFFVQFSIAQTPVPVSVSDFCNGSTKSLDSYLPAGNPTRTYSWTTSSITNVKNYTSVATGQSSITQTLNLNTSLTANGSIVYNVTTSDGLLFKMTVTVLPTPYISNRPSAATTTGCGSISISGLASSISTPANGWLWTRGAILGTLQQSGNTNGILDNLIDTTPNQVAVKYAFAITAANGCVGNDTITYTVLPTPFITNIIKNDSICSGLSYIFNPSVAPSNNAAGGVGTYFTWTNPTATSGLSGYSTNPTNTTTNFVQTITNNTSSIITTVYSLVPSFKYSTTTCTGPSFQVYLSINPRPYLPTPIALSTCTGIAFSYAPTDGASAGSPLKTTILPTSTQFTWAAPIYSDTSAVTGASGIIGSAPPSTGSTYVSAPISQTLINKSNTDQTAQYNIYATSTYGTISCSALAPFNLIVTVKSAPKVNLTQDSFAVCSGSAPVLPNMPSVASYSWGAPQVSPANSLTGATAGGSGNSFSPIVLNTTATSVIANYTLTPYSSGNCAGNPFPVVLNINPVANISIQNLSVCSGSKFSFTPPGVPQNTVYTWSSPNLNSSSLKVTGSSTNIFPNGDTSISATINYYGLDSGSIASFTITPRTGNCLGAPFTLNAYIKPLPNISSSSVNVCSGNTFSYTPTSNLTQVNTNYTWNLPTTTPDSSSLSGATNNNAPKNNITQTLTNSFTQIEQANYIIIPSANGCTGPSFSLTANVNPTPVFTNKDTIICSGYPFSMNPSPLPSITAYTWEAPVYNIPNSILGGYSQNTPLPNISQVLTNTNNSLDVLATYKVTPSYNSCIGNPFKLTVTVKASPYITDTLRSIVCSDNAFSVKLPSNIPSSTQFIWDNPTYSNGVTGGGANTVMQKTISQTLKNINSDTTTGYAYYNVTPIANGCYGLPFPLKVSVKTSSASLISPTTLPSICSGANFTYTPLSNFPNTAFSWIRDSVPGISNTSKNGFADINEVLTDTTGQPVNVTYKYTLQYNGCANLKTQLVNVTIKPIPTLVSPSQGTPICSGNTFNYIPISNTLNTSFNWQRSYVVGVSETISTGSNSISESLHNTTLNQIQVPYIFSLNANGCSNTQTIYEIVNPVLQLNDQLNAVCSGSNFQITPPNTVNATFLWNAPNVANGIVGGTENTLIPKSSITGSLTNLADTPNVAVYRIIPYIPGASTGNCAGVPFNVKVIVNPIPILSSTTLLPDLCSGTNFSYIPTSKTPGTIFSWSRDNAMGISNAASNGSFAINETLMDTTTLPIIVLYKYKTTYNGCTDSSKVVSFTINPAPIITNQNITICSNTAFSLPISLEPNGTTYTWNTPIIIPNNNITGASTKTIPQTIVSETLNNTGTINATAIYTIQPQYPLCPLKPFTATITVKPISLIGNQTAIVCNNKLLSYIPTGTPIGTQFKWVFNNPNPPFALAGFTNNDSLYQNSITQTITNNSNNLLYADYLIKPSTNDCIGNEFYLKVAVNPSPTVQANAQNYVCQNASDTVQLNFTGTAPWAFSYTDNKNNTLTTVNGITQNPYNFIQSNLPNTGNYVFSILHLNDAYCHNDTSLFNPSLASIHQALKKLPTDSILTPTGSLICSGSFQPMQINRIENSYQWYLNGSIIPNGIGINYNAYTGGVYAARITDSFGCSNYAINTVKMYDLKTFNLNFSTDSLFCINTSKQFINLTDTSALRNISWKWDFNGEDSSSNYSSAFSFAKAGIKKVTLYAKIPSCTYSISKDSIMVLYAPVPNMILPTLTTTSGRNLQLQARQFQGAPYVYKWQPSIGLNNNSISNPIFNYFRSQDFYIEMTSPEGCITNDILKVKVFDSAIADIFIPKSFTPNGDGNNDILYAYLAGISNLNYFKIFNKYGKLLFETRNPAEGWDGNFSGTKQPMDVYVWIAEGVDNTGKTVRKNGNVLLIR